MRLVRRVLSAKACSRQSWFSLLNQAPSGTLAASTNCLMFESIDTPPALTRSCDFLRSAGSFVGVAE